MHVVPFLILERNVAASRPLLLSLSVILFYFLSGYNQLSRRCTKQNRTSPIKETGKLILLEVTTAYLQYFSCFTCLNGNVRLRFIQDVVLLRIDGHFNTNDM